MIFLLGILISFIGQLPIGFINLVAVKIAIEKSTKQSINYAIGIAIVELVYLEVILHSIQLLISNNFIYRVLQVIMSVAFIIAGIVIFYKWKQAKNTVTAPNIILKHNSFMYGVFLSATNLAQVPFWILCTTYLINTKLLEDTTLSYQLFIWGTGVGTFLGILVYIFTGKRLVEKYTNVTRYLDLIIAIFLIIAACFQVIDILRNL